jgi:hypothetical protein
MARLLTGDDKFPVLWRKRRKTFEGGAAIFSGCPEPTSKPSRPSTPLSQLHAELAGKFLEARRQGVRLKTAMMQVEAVLQMLQPGFSVASIAAKRNKSNPWFKRGGRCSGAP